MLKIHSRSLFPVSISNPLSLLGFIRSSSTIHAAKHLIRGFSLLTMVAEVINDPIDDFTLLNLLPRTFKGLKKTSNQNDMELINNHHKSVAIKNSENFMGQVRSILDRKSEDVNNELPCPVQSDNKEEYIVVEKEKIREKERRRGLLGHHERLKFSLKPKDMSQTNLNLEDMEKEIEKISDPDDFFKAYERLENAKKEIQRQTGGIPANPIKDTTSRTTRVRRPDLGTVRHKHRYSLVDAGSNEGFSSQFETDFSSQSRDKPNTVTMVQRDPTTVTMDQDDPTAESILMDVGLEKDSVAAAQNNVNHILDELLSTSCTDLDGDGAVPFLQERLQIKPINVEKLSLPDLDSFRSISVMATAERAGKSKESLSEMESLIRQSRNKTSTETSPESPLASVSLLRKRLSQMGRTASPFSFRGINYSPARSTSLIKGKDIRDHSPDVECVHNNEANDTTAEAPDKKASSASCEFHSAMLVNDDTAGTNTVSEKLAMDTEVCSTGGPGGVLQDKVEDVCQETATSQQKETDLEGSWNTDCSGSLLDGVNSIVGEHLQGNGDSLAANIHSMQNNEVEDMRPKGVASEQKEPGLEDLSSGDIDCSGSQLGESISATGKHQTGDAVPQTVVVTEQNEETYPEPSLNGNRKRKPPLENRIERHKSRRKSLAGAGTEGESEVRRSTRSRTRPLEYWRGEHFLDGRAQNESVSSMGKHQTGDSVSENPDILAEHHNEAYPGPSLNENRKKKAPAENRKERQSTHRNSLADESVSSMGKHQTGDVVSENPDILTEQQDETYPKPSLNKNRKKKAPVQNIMERRSTRQKNLGDESVSSMGKHQIGDVVSENPDILVEQHDETYPEPSLNKNSKKKTPVQNRKERQITRRKSLAGAGTKWESGVRRSTRHRIRPLEYWKGERLLYARIHESLLTVIGVKYESPPKSKKEKPTFRVKSYVSDEYKELVEYAALH